MQRTTFRAVKNAHCAVHVDAAQHDYASRRTTEDVHQLFRLRTRADDQINHHIGSKAPQFLSTAIELITITSNLIHAGGCSRAAAVEHC